MQRATTTIALAAFLIMFVCCNDATDDRETTGVDTTDNDRSDTVAAKSFPYDPAKDGLLVGAQFSKKLGDTLGIKFYELTLKPGDSASLHSHPDHTVYVLQGGQLAVYFDGTNRQVMDLKAGMGFVSGPVNDAAKNVGKTTIKLVIADVYR